MYGRVNLVNVKVLALATVRVLGVLFGLMLTLSMLADIAGLVPHSIETPPLASRVLHAMPALIAGIVLLIPHRLITGRATLIALSVAYVCILFGLAVKSMRGIDGFVAGHLHWAVIPVSLAIMVIVLGNLLALHERRAAGSRA